MLTLEMLKEYGADVENGLKRCVNNESLYLRLTSMVPSNESFKKLHSSIKNEDLDSAFEAAHALKGILSNLSITPLLEPILKITELLRNRTHCDYSLYLTEIEEKRQKLEELCK